MQEDLSNYYLKELLYFKHLKEDLLRSQLHRWNYITQEMLNMTNESIESIERESKCNISTLIRKLKIDIITNSNDTVKYLRDIKLSNMLKK